MLFCVPEAALLWLVLERVKEEGTEEANTLLDCISHPSQTRVIVLGGEASGRWLGCEHGIFRRGIRVLRPLPTPTGARSPLLPCGDMEKTAIYEPENRPRQTPDLSGSSVWDFPASRSVRNKCLWFINPPVCGILLQPRL